MDETFECAWCKMSNPDDPELFTHDVIFVGGYDVETGLPLCEGCADAGEPVDTQDDK